MQNILFNIMFCLLNISFLKEVQNNYYLRIENIVNTIIEVGLPQLRKLDMGNFTIDHQYTIEVGGRSKDNRRKTGFIKT